MSTGHEVATMVELTLAGRKVLPLGHILWVEDLQEGVSLRFDVALDNSSAPAVGDPVRLKLETACDDCRHASETLAWSHSVTVSRVGRGGWANVVARDPLGFCACDRQFVSHAGRVTLLQLAGALLDAQPGRLEGLVTGSGGARVEQDWLLQYDESGKDFLGRIAASTGSLVFFQRRALACAGIGDPPQGREPIALDFESGLIDWSEIATQDLAPRQLAWIDPERRSNTILRFGERGRTPAGALSGRTCAAVEPRPAAVVGTGRSLEPGEAVEASTWRPDLALGTAIRCGEGAIRVIERIEHSIRAAGAYSNRVTAVAPARWGVRRRALRRGMVGPLQAEVSSVDDPQRQGRIRVVLSEDAEQRPSPWIPCLSPCAGPALGHHWLPDRGDLVLVLADAECPELLTCMGAVRGFEQRADASWVTADNSRKVLVAKGELSITFDERAGALELRAGSSSVRLERGGRIAIHAGEIEADADGRVTINGGGPVAIDGPRINLGC